MLRMSRAGPRTIIRRIQTFDVLSSDLNITQSGKTVIASGSGGRSSRTGYTATVFGGPGMLGTILVAKLGRHGTITVVPFREDMAKRHLKVTGDLGVINFMEWDLRNIKSIEDSVKHSDIVYNLVGHNCDTKNFSLEDVHQEGARRIAEAAAKYNVSRFVHVSSHSASVDSPSRFLASKGRGEQIVRDIIPDATIVRPGPIYGVADRFLNSIAASKYLLSANENKEIIRPVHVNDVALALEKIGFDDATAGKTFELSGPSAYSMADVIEIVRETTFNDIRTINLPKGLYQQVAGLAQKLLFWTTTSPDEIERMFIDQTVDPTALTFHDLGIDPVELKDMATHLLRHHRSYLYTRDNMETDAKNRRSRPGARIIS